MIGGRPIFLPGNVSFKPFTTSRAQRQALAEKLNRQRLIDTTELVSESEGKPTTGTNDSTEVSATGTLNNKVAGPTDIKRLIDIAKSHRCLGSVLISGRYFC